MAVSGTAELCTADPLCKGFNSNGWYKHNICGSFPACSSTWTADNSQGF
jgi:hypothetical protein